MFYSHVSYFTSLLLSKYFDSTFNSRENVKEMSIYAWNIHLSLLFCFCKVVQENQIPGDMQLVKALTAVLTASQRFMRDQEVV